MTTNDETTVRVEMMDGASRCRNFNSRGRQCGNYTRRVVVIVRNDREDIRRSDCGKH